MIVVLQDLVEEGRLVERPDLQLHPEPVQCILEGLRLIARRGGPGDDEESELTIWRKHCSYSSGGMKS